jgi:predicted nucleotidyltransferase
VTQTQLTLFAALNSGNVEYLVVGGVAVNAYGYIRSTQDLDIFIRPTVENAQRAFAALQALGLDLPGDASDLLVDYENLRFGTRPDQVDLLNSIGEMPFEWVWRNRELVTIDGVEVPFISKADLIENKLQVGRLRDLVDVEELQSRSGPTSAPEPI